MVTRTRSTTAAKPRQKPVRRRRPRQKRLRKRWLILGVPLGVFATLVALAPGTPRPDAIATLEDEASGAALGAFRYQSDDEVYALDFDPRKVRLGLLEGWDREQDAYEDSAALAYVSGPMYERHIDNGGQEITVPLGDLKFGQKVWQGRNRTASRQRAFVGIKRDGGVDFGYGELTSERAEIYDMFVGGLHSVYNDLNAPPYSYKGAYSISMGQRIRYYLPRIRMVYGLRSDGRLEMLMSRDGLTLEQTRELARRRGLVAAYMPDHASKSRLIIPGVKGFTEEDANWISGGATSFVHVPYLLRLSERRFHLQGGLVGNLSESLRSKVECQGPLDCAEAAGHRLMDKALAGLNRVMEQGVEPVARLIWQPKRQPLKPGFSQDEQLGRPERSPLPEPPITADPLVLLEQPRPNDELDAVEPESAFPSYERDLPPDLPPPVLLTPEPSPKRGSPLLPSQTYDPSEPIAGSIEGSDPIEDQKPSLSQTDALIGAPPPPLLPPPAP
ncbi:hypothetical protein [Synechococcus sp. BIOS-U3-1]|uniref:hypothetical protein n=1 Tax=Synechococcus sp. BIOS-U3-1 TaxID=1400865 RepID=UPI0021077208|nr:hypothetical protein [Synechococcus sp. BIOS-U3-1]